MNRLKYFNGVVYMISFGAGPHFGAYADKWAELMPTTKRPEFSEFDLCVNTTSGINRICKGHPGFKGWQDGKHDVALQCRGYTGLAYDAAVVLAVVADKMITKGKIPSKLTSADWLENRSAAQHIAA